MNGGYWRQDMTFWAADLKQLCSRASLYGAHTLVQFKHQLIQIAWGYKLGCLTGSQSLDQDPVGEVSTLLAVTQSLSAPGPNMPV